MNRIQIAQAVRACVIATLALCFVFQQTTDGTPAAGQTGSGAADMILINGFIWTVDGSKPQAEAVAVRGDRIIKVGGNEEVLAQRGEHTRLIDLKGAFVTPGFNDNHVHFASAASFFWNLQLMDVHSDEAFVARVKEYVGAHPGDARVVQTARRVVGRLGRDPGAEQRDDHRPG